MRRRAFTDFVDGGGEARIGFAEGVDGCRQDQRKDEERKVEQEKIN